MTLTNDIPNIDWPRTACTFGAETSALEMGYVTWSSTRSALCPIHSVKTITWTSERSGIASSDACWTDAHPQADSARTKRMVSSGRPALAPMMRATRPFDLGPDASTGALTAASGAAQGPCCPNTWPQC